MRQAYDYWQDQPGISRTPLSSNRDPSRSHGPSKGPRQPEFQCPNQRAAPLFQGTHKGARHPTNFPSVAEHFSNKRDFGARRPKPVMKQKFSRVRFNVPAANRFRGQNCGCAVRNFCCFCEGQIEKKFFTWECAPHSTNGYLLVRAPLAPPRAHLHSDFSLFSSLTYTKTAIGGWLQTFPLALAPLM